MITIGSSFDDFDLVIDSFQLSIMNGIVTVVEDPIAISLDSFGELGDGLVMDSSGHGTPLIDGLIGSGARPIRPDVFQFLFEDQDCINDRVQFQELLQMFAVFRSTYVGSVFQQQIFGSLIKDFIRFSSFVAFSVSLLVDDAVKIGDHMGQIK